MDGESGMPLERAANWGKRDGFAGLGSASWGKTRRSAAVILDNVLGLPNVLSHRSHCTYEGQWSAGLAIAHGKTGALTTANSSPS